MFSHNYKQHTNNKIDLQWPEHISCAIGDKAKPPNDVVKTFLTT